MTEFEKRDSILVLDLSGDAWNDDAYILATDILNAFTPEDWRILNILWPEKKDSWKALLADALSGAPPEKSIGILLTMIASENDTVAEPAVRSLAGFKDRILPDSLTREQRDRIAAMAAKSPFSAAILRDFIRRIFPDAAAG